MKTLNKLEYNKVFYYFEEISNIPRGSGNEKAVSDYVVRFAKDRGLYCRQDEALNVVIKKAGTEGYTASASVILQGHLDMVCEKNSDTKHDFIKDPLALYIDGDFIRAKGTTLGADNGIAIAMTLALLDSKDISHPPIEAIFTTDEEVGMQGAKVFNPKDITGKLFINMDTEEEGNLLVSCSGGQRVIISLPVEREVAPQWGKAYSLSIGGLKGGHSGADIHLERANANKLMGRVLGRLMDTFENRLISVVGGMMDNAISREASAVLCLHTDDVQAINEILAVMQQTFINEYGASDNAVSITLSPLTEKIQQVLTKDTAEKVKDILILIPYGVESKSVLIPGLVESSSNIGVVRTEEEYISFCSASRSCVSSRKEAILDKMRSLARLTGAKCESVNDYPAWTFNPNSKLVKLFQEVYNEMYSKDAIVTAIHAGLECGLFGEKIPDLDMISIGPNMFDVHTPQERLSISSTVRTWEFLQEVLKKLK